MLQWHVHNDVYHMLNAKCIPHATSNVSLSIPDPSANFGFLTLRLSHVTLTAADVKTISMTCPLLTTLTFDHCISCDGDVMRNIPHLQHVTYLRLIHTDVTELDVVALKSHFLHYMYMCT